MKEIEKIIERLKVVKCSSLMDLYRGLAVDIEMAIKALEKQIPKNPIKAEKQDICHTTKYECPSCKGEFTGTGIACYCYRCGQALKWNKEVQVAPAQQGGEK